MNLSFLPGELHLYKSESGQFVVKMAGKEVLSTKSQRAALAKFNALRTELEIRFPARAPTPDRRESWDSPSPEERLMISGKRCKLVNSHVVARGASNTITPLRSPP